MFAATLTGCATAAQRQASTIKGTVQAAVAQVKQCTADLYSKSEYASLRPHLLSPDRNFQPTMAQLSDETYATKEEAKLLASFQDEADDCKRPAVEKISSVAPKVGVILADIVIESDSTTLRIIKQKITWGASARERQAYVAKSNRKVAEAAQELDSNLTVAHNQELQQRQAAANALMQWSQEQQMITALRRPITTNCSQMGQFTNCTTY
jgi:hypothetical protein